MSRSTRRRAIKAAQLRRKKNRARDARIKEIVAMLPTTPVLMHERFRARVEAAVGPEYEYYSPHFEPPIGS